MNLKIVETDDGLHSIYVAELDEHYHSTHGALQEAKHIFIEAGLHFKAQCSSRLSILEIGFGTGLNAYLTALASASGELNVVYNGLELHPVPLAVIDQLNYVEIIGEAANREEFRLLHSSAWDIPVSINENFEFTKINQSVFDFKPSQKYDLIYFDAFGFRAQEEMWSLEVFQKMSDSLNVDGALVTYCSKGEVRRRMQQCGLIVSKLPGPSGKREMVRAVKA